MLVTPRPQQNSFVEILIPSVTVLEGRAFGEGSILMNKKERRNRAPCLLLPWGHREKSNSKPSQTRQDPDSRPLPSRTVRKKLLLLISLPGSGITASIMGACQDTMLNCVLPSTLRKKAMNTVLTPGCLPCAPTSMLLSNEIIILSFFNPTRP